MATSPGPVPKLNWSDGGDDSLGRPPRSLPPPPHAPPVGLVVFGGRQGAGINFGGNGVSRDPGVAQNTNCSGNWKVPGFYCLF